MLQDIGFGCVSSLEIRCIDQVAAILHVGAEPFLSVSRARISVSILSLPALYHLFPAGNGNACPPGDYVTNSTHNRGPSAKERTPIVRANLARGWLAPSVSEFIPALPVSVAPPVFDNRAITHQIKLLQPSVNATLNAFH